MSVRWYRCARLLLFVILLSILVTCGTNQVPGQPGAISTGTAPAREGTTISSPTPTSCSTTPTVTPTPTPSPVPRPTPTPARSEVPPAPLSTGKVILVSLARQWLYAYNDGTLAFNNAVETGRPELPTPTGVFSVLEKVRNITFTSPWPPGSPYYYEPTHINYALMFKAGGYFLHDAWWHVKFGPGSNVPHQLPNGNWETGSHGCVGMPISDAQRLYGWAPIGTPVLIRNT
ncbi:MAG TPA: L,D-transpeptidase [Ktedonobacteraceae bacterium]|nr:L,D-transpeptidase [Ktedonobacteraceae bacterium]